MFLSVVKCINNNYSTYLLIVASQLGVVMDFSEKAL